MKFAATLLVAICLAFASHASPEPTADSETAIEPSEAPVMPIRVGGPCTYETSEIDATVLQVADGQVSMSQAEDRNFNLAAAAFTAPPVAGDVIRVTKRKITKGTCQPLIYTLAVPPADETPPAN
ncbi:MAG: hypothetical protein RLO80_11500 [Hyphomonas sp.]